MRGEQPEREAASPEPEPEAPDANRAAMLDSMRLMANKGWLPERRLMVIHDYFQSRGLFADFNNFIRKLR